jgi:hypothetical protein
MSATPVATRRALQDYSRLHLCLTPSVWAELQGSESLIARCEALFARAWALGLRCPSESTLAHLTALSSVFHPAPKTGFEHHNLYQAVKGAWRSFSKRNSKFDAAVDEYVTCLSTVEQLSEKTRANLGAEAVVACPVEESLLWQRSQVPLRRSNSLVPKTATSDVSGQAALCSSVQVLATAFATLASGKAQQRQPQQPEEPLPSLKILQPSKRLAGQASGSAVDAETSLHLALQDCPRTKAPRATTSGEACAGHEAPAALPEPATQCGDLESALGGNLEEKAVTPSGESVRAKLEAELLDRAPCKGKPAARSSGPKKRPAAAASQVGVPERKASGKGTVLKTLKRPAAQPLSAAARREAILKIVPDSLKRQYRLGCSKCRARPLCTVSCWRMRGFSVP